MNCQEKYTSLHDYTLGKISEMLDCDECALTEHQANHLHDIEQHIDTLEQEGTPDEVIPRSQYHRILSRFLDIAEQHYPKYYQSDFIAEMLDEIKRLDGETNTLAKKRDHLTRY